MRNYIFTRALQWRWEDFDDMHVSQGSGPSYAVAGNDVELKARIEDIIKSHEAGLPPTWSTEWTYPDASITMYVLLDKSTMMRILQAFEGSFVGDAYSNHPPYFSTLSNPEKTPRDTGWTDPDGEKREPTPSEGGTKAPKGGGGFDIVQIILLIINQLGALGPVAQPVIDQGSRLIVAIFKGTVTQAQVDAFFAAAEKLLQSV